MDKQFYTIAISLLLLAHVAWLLFVIAGAYFTSGRPRLTALHIAALVWGILAETGPWPCPLTLAENALEAHAGIAPYSGGFILHYLDRTIYPDLSAELVTACGVAVCALNLAIYAYRCWRRFEGKRFKDRRRAGQP